MHQCTSNDHLLSINIRKNIFDTKADKKFLR